MLEKLTKKMQLYISGGIIVAILLGIFIYEETKSTTPGSTGQTPKTLAVEGIAAFKSGDLTLAKELFTQELAASGGSTNEKSIAEYNLGTVAVRKQGVSIGLKYYQEAVTLNPKFALAWLNIGVAEGSLGNGSAALTAYNALLNLDPTNIEGLYNSGIILYDTGKKAEGLTRLKAAIEKQPTLIANLPKNIKLS